MGKLTKLYPYKYKYGAFGSVRVECVNLRTQVEMNILSRYLFGEGLSANQIFNCGTAAVIIFQYSDGKNIERAKFLTKIFRTLKKENITINSKTFPPLSKIKLEF